MKRSLSASLILMMMFSNDVYSEEIEIRTPSGDYITLDIASEEPFINVVQNIEYLLSTNASSPQSVSARPHHFVLDYMFATNMPQMTTSTPRNYQYPVSSSERSDIKYIITTLATGSWTQLLKNKSSLEKAGDRVDSVHPLRFLQCIFSEEELKAGLHSIYDRSRIYKHFTDGLFDSLEQESNRDNLKEEYVIDFSNNLGINPALIMPLITNKKWSNLLSTLINLLPRKGNPGRYDM